jgi:myo-inositol-1(or 4)-monophosphatase
MKFALPSAASQFPDETRLALEAAHQGGVVLRRFWQQLAQEQIHEKSRGDLVTAADIAAEETIAEHLSRQMPEAAIVSEEGTARAGSGKVWYVDPLDGTTNFVQGFPVFAVSVGLVESSDLKNPTLLSGVVFNPVTGDMFYAARGRGSYLGDVRLGVGTKTKLADAVIATGFPRRYHAELATYLREFRALFPQCRAIRRAGAASLDLCWTAQGVFDGFWEHKLSPWDIAAGVLIVQEAGGRCTDFEDQAAFLENGNILGASPAIHAELLSTIRRSHADQSPI